MATLCLCCYVADAKANLDGTQHSCTFIQVQGIFSNEKALLVTDVAAGKINIVSAFSGTGKFVCARLAQLVRSLTANHEVPGSIPGPLREVELWETFFRHTVRGQGR